MTWRLARWPFGGTYWDRGVRYPNTSLGEDAAFLARARRRGARLERIDGEGLFIYVRHTETAGASPAANTSIPPIGGRWRCGRSRPRIVASTPASPRRANVVRARVGRAAWPGQAPARHGDHAHQGPASSRRPRGRLLPPPGLRPARADRARRRTAAHRRAPASRPAEHPLRSPRTSRCRSGKSETGRAPRPRRRIVHWDDDDWYAPHRISYQVGSCIFTRCGRVRNEPAPVFRSHAGYAHGCMISRPGPPAMGRPGRASATG